MIKIINFLKKTNSKKLLFICLGFGLLLRLVISIGYGSITHFPDSQDYLNFSQQISRLDFSNYSAKRTPGFPIIIALLQNNLLLLVILQQILGLITLYFIFSLILKLNGKIIAFTTTLIFAGFINIIYFEFAILTETLSQFLLILSLWLIVKYDLFNTETKIYKFIFLGLTLGGLYLTRPIFIFMSLGFFIFFIVKNYKTRHFLKPAIILLINFAVYFSWNSYNKYKVDAFINTQYLGINLAQTATPFFEKTTNDKYGIKPILLKHRDSILKHNPKALPMSVWFAFEELKEKTKLTDLELSTVLGEMSSESFKQYPLLYTKQVFQSWKGFWANPHIFYNLSKFNSIYFRQINHLFWFNFQAYVVLFVNLIFLVICAIKCLNFVRFKIINFNIELFIIAIILSGSLSQALVVYGSNSRFCMPFFSLIIYVVVLNIFKFTTSNTK